MDDRLEEAKVQLRNKLSVVCNHMNAERLVDAFLELISARMEDPTPQPLPEGMAQAMDPEYADHLKKQSDRVQAVEAFRFVACLCNDLGIPYLDLSGPISSKVAGLCTRLRDLFVKTAERTEERLKAQKAKHDKEEQVRYQSYAQSLNELNQRDRARLSEIETLKGRLRDMEKAQSWDVRRHEGVAAAAWYLQERGSLADLRTPDLVLTAYLTRDKADKS